MICVIIDIIICVISNHMFNYIYIFISNIYIYIYTHIVQYIFNIIYNIRVYIYIILKFTYIYTHIYIYIYIYRGMCPFMRVGGIKNMIKHGMLIPNDWHLTVWVAQPATVTGYIELYPHVFRCNFRFFRNHGVPPKIHCFIIYSNGHSPVRPFVCQANGAGG